MHMLMSHKKTQAIEYKNI